MPLSTTAKVMSPPGSICYEENEGEASGDMEKEQHQGNNAPSGVGYEDDTTGSEGQRIHLGQGTHLCSNTAQELPAATKILYSGLDMVSGEASPDAEETTSPMERAMQIFFSESDDEMTETLAATTTARGSKVPPLHVSTVCSRSLSESRSDGQRVSSQSNLQLHTKGGFLPSSPHQAEGVVATSAQEPSFKNSENYARNSDSKIEELTNNGGFQRSGKPQVLVSPQFSTPSKESPQSNGRGMDTVPLSLLSGEGKGSRSSVEEMPSNTRYNYDRVQSHRTGDDEGLRSISGEAVRFIPIPDQAQKFVNTMETHDTEPCVFTAPTLGTVTANFLSRDKQLSEDPTTSSTRIALDTATRRKSEAAGTSQPHIIVSDGCVNKVVPLNTKPTGEEGLHGGSLCDSWQEPKLTRAQPPPTLALKGIDTPFEPSEGTNSTTSEDSKGIGLGLSQDGFPASLVFARGSGGKGGAGALAPSPAGELGPKEREKGRVPPSFNATSGLGPLQPHRLHELMSLSEGGGGRGLHGEGSGAAPRWHADSTLPPLNPNACGPPSSSEVLTQEKAMHSVAGKEEEEGEEGWGASNARKKATLPVDVSEERSHARHEGFEEASVEAGDALTSPRTPRASHSPISSSGESAEPALADEVSGPHENNALQEETSMEVEDTFTWSENLAAMTLLDVTPFSSVFHGRLARGASGDRDMSPLFGSTPRQAAMTLMVINVYERMRPPIPGGSRPSPRQRALQVAQNMLRTQQSLQAAGLTGPARCRGIVGLHVDASNRLLAELDTSPCDISLSDVLAFQVTLLSRDGLVALLRSVLTALALFHNAHRVHGALHGGNVLLSTDDGSCTLAQPAGLMNLGISPDDLSVLSPAKAAVLEPRLKRALLLPSSHSSSFSSPLSFMSFSSLSSPSSSSSSSSSSSLFSSWLEDEQERCAFELELEMEGKQEGEGAGVLQPTDDLYAIGSLALFAITGIPLFHGAAYQEVVRTLAGLHALVASGELCECASHGGKASGEDKQSVRKALRARILGICFTQSPYVSLRCQQAGYTEHFLNGLFEFIVDSMAASFGVIDDGIQYHNAEDLLEHSFFKEYPLEGEESDSGIVDEGEVMQIMQDTLHRVAYPVYVTIAQNKTMCDTKPYIARMHRHSIFSSRWIALKKSIQCFCGADLWNTGSEERGSDDKSVAATTLDGISALWPALERRASNQWTVTVPQTWSLPSLSESSTSKIGGPTHCDPYGSQMFQLPYIDTQSAGKVSDGSAHGVVGGEFYFPSRSTRLRITPHHAGDPCMRDSNLCRWIPQNWASDKIFLQEKAGLEQQVGCKVLLRFRTILFASKQNSLLKIQQGQIDYFSDVVDTVVLKDLEGCRIELLVPFRFVILVNVKRCEVYLAPCFICYMHQVTDCTPVAVSCTYLVLRHVADTALHCTAAVLVTGDMAKGEGDATRSLDSDATLKDVRWEPYSLLYPGLSEESLRVGLPQECLAYTRCIEEGIAPISAGCISAHISPQQRKSTRDFNFIRVGPRTDDIPYSHALVAYGKVFRHCDDNVSDVYFFFNELHGKDVHMTNVHGTTKSETQGLRGKLYGDVHTFESQMVSINIIEETELSVKPRRAQVTSDPSQLLGYRGMQRYARSDAHEADAAGSMSLSRVSRCPVIFVLDVVDDVEIKDCSHCTVFLVGSKGSMMIENCHHMRIFCVARECGIKACTNLEIFALFTEYIALEHCCDVTMSPLFMQCPYLDTILESIIQETSEEYQEYIFETYEQRDIYALNKVFQLSGKDVCFSECVRVDVRDLDWYQRQHKYPMLITVSVPVFGMEESGTSTTSRRGGTRACEASDEETDEGELFSVAEMSACNFFRECCEAAGLDMNSHFPVCPFSAMLYGCAPQNSIDKERSKASKLAQVVRIHDLFNPSLSRLPGSLSIRSGCSAQPRGESARQEDLLQKQPPHFQGHCSDLSDEYKKHAEFACDVVLERVVMGEVRLLEAVGNLYIRNCTGPLDIVVCAAKYVVMEGCVNVTLHATCIAFDAQDSHHCHVALHVNNPPGYLRCSHMLTSVWNVVATNIEALWRSVDVKVDENVFNRPLIYPITMRHVTDRPAEGGGKRRLSLPRSSTSLGDDSGSGPQHGIVQEAVCLVEKGTRVESLVQAFAYLRRPIAVVPPLPELLITLGGGKPHSTSPLNVPPMKKNESTQTLEDTLRLSLAFIAESNLALHASEENEGDRGMMVVGTTATVVAVATAATSISTSRRTSPPPLDDTSEVRVEGLDLSVPEEQSKSCNARTPALKDGRSSPSDVFLPCESRQNEFPAQSPAAAVRVVEHEGPCREPRKSTLEVGERETSDGPLTWSHEGNNALEGQYLNPQGYGSPEENCGALQWELENVRQRYRRWKEGDPDGKILTARVAAAIQKINQYHAERIEL